MHIQCTKKCLDFLKPNIIEKNTDHDLHAWHANYFNIDRKKCFVIMNDMTRFCIILYGVKKSDFKDPIYMIQKALLFAMHFEGYPEKMVLKYVNQIKEITYGKTKNRTLVAQLNRACEDAWLLSRTLLYDQLYQADIQKRLNEGFVGTNHWKEIHIPAELMRSYLEFIG